MTTKTEKSDQTSASVQVDLNLKATELRLGPPGSESPERENLGFLKNLVSGAKRGFNEGGDEGKSLNGSAIENDVETGSAEKTKAQNHNSSAAVHASNKTQVVGWPPIRSFRKNSMAPNPPKTNVKGDHKMEAGCLYVKVSMDGAPYLRKVDLDKYGSYAELSAALEKMFSCFTIGQYGYNGVPGRDGLCLSGSRLKDLPNSSEQCVLTYEDKDGDWMLVGDVPWDMFTNTCKRIRITKSSEAIGLSPRAMEKCK